MSKVQFGISNVYLFTRTVGANNAVTYSSPVHLPGSVSLTLEPQAEDNIFYADNIKYWVSNTMQGYEVELEVASIPDAIKTAFLGYATATNDNLVETNATGGTFGMVFQFETDTESRRCQLFNCTMSRPDEEHNTQEESTDPDTQSLTISVAGDTVGTVVCFKSEIHKDDANYATAFTAMALPVFSSGS